MKHSGAKQAGGSASELITNRIASLADWRGETLGRIRAWIKEADPEIVEEWKWMGTPVWSHDGIVTTGEAYKSVVKMTFAKGASLKDPSRLFNSSLDGNVRRAIDFHEGEKIDVAALKALLREAIALNVAKKKPGSKRPAAPAKAPATKTAPTKRTSASKPAAKKPATTKRAVAPKASTKKAAPKRAPR